MLALLALADVFAWGAIIFDHDNAAAEYYFLNVGQGDSELVMLPHRVKLLIDGGPSDGLLRELARVLPPADRYIDLVLMTHPQLDHFEGFIELFDRYRVGAFLATGRRGETAAYNELIKRIRVKGIPYIALAQGDRMRYGDIVIDVLSPSVKNLTSKELNDTSLVLMVSDGRSRALFTGDIGANVEAELSRQFDLSADVLKVGHHGSRFSSSREFLMDVRPKVAVIEVGKNSYGHPTKDALARLTAIGAHILRTDQNGALRVFEKDGALHVFVAGQ